MNYTPQGTTLSLSQKAETRACKSPTNAPVPATLVRLLTINSLNAYITSWVLYLSGGSEDPRLLLPAWISIASVRSVLSPVTAFSRHSSSSSSSSHFLLTQTVALQTLTILYHLTHPRLAILKETSLSISVFSIASFISMVSLLLQLHLTRENDPPVPLFELAKLGWAYVKIGVRMIQVAGRDL